MVGMPLSAYHRWITALWYPAILGTAIMAWLGPQSAQGGQHQFVEGHWAPVLIAYFALQYGEDVGRAKTYDFWGLLSDILEMLVILLAFDHMGFLDIRFPGWLPLPTLATTLATAFLIPVIARVCRRLFNAPPKGASCNRTRSKCLSSLSLLAATTATFGVEHWQAAVAVAGMLTVYFVFFLPPRTAGEKGGINQLRRPVPEP